MNLFVLDRDPALAASYHCDKHVVKMIVETAQLLCTAHHIEGSLDVATIPYRKTHANHPCAHWVRESSANYSWACCLGLELCLEYTRRYSKIHKSQAVIEWAMENYLRNDGELTPFPQCMPEQYHDEDVVEAYRRYYRGEKASFAKWKNSEPYWWQEQIGV